MIGSVQEVCKQKRLSRLELADRSGLDIQKVRAIFLGRWTPTPKEREGIAKALKVTQDEIAWGHNTPIQHIYGHGPG